MTATRGTNQWNAHGKRALRLSQLKPRIEMHLNMFVSSNANLVNWLENSSLKFEFGMLQQFDTDRDLVRRMFNCGLYADSLRLLCLDSVISRGVAEKRIEDEMRRFTGKLGVAATIDFVCWSWWRRRTC
jgi:hypothetical protein